ncbi:IPT/TIG domain-containing protein [Microbacterium sp. Kw_RZR3]|uniref:IPT/TIG domain-containing protein n=1 Tax=Microbacterium sp. Kw_RZR3 TaxID=3032903 RepID=UPI0023DA7FCD|nr:IPT/TIG domain-containing protein [Microbacterium sp. Kw_RZR3]MDF2045151.1 IPT/TIG domain-containing protein [Microbacterium sp. Kw_RZR3]
MPAALIENGRTINAADVRLVQDGRILLGAYGITAPTGPDWNPTADLAAGIRHDLGYYGEDGFSLTPEPGDNKRFVAHNEDVVIDQDGPGTWAVAFSGIQRSKTLTEAYFDTTVDPATGSFVLTKASVNTFRDLVTVGISGDDVIVTHYPRVKVADREAVQFGANAINALGMTLRAFRDPILGYQVKQWDTTLIQTVTPAPTITSTVPDSAQAPAGNVIITGTGFSGVTSVKFGSAQASFQIKSPTEILAIMPGGTAGTANLTVTNSGGTSTAKTFARS